MSVKLIVNSQVINFPTSGTDQNWAQAVTQFAEAVTDKLDSLSSQFDVEPTVQNLLNDANNQIDIEKCEFPSGLVRSFNFVYAIYRTNGSGLGTITLSEQGFVNAVYDTENEVWILQHEFSGRRQSNGLPYHTFSMSGDKLQFTSVAIGGSYDSIVSKLSYSAKTNLVSEEV